MQTFLILVGPPGSGKSSLGRDLSRVVSLPYISTGDILRAGNHTSTRDACFAPDDLMSELVLDRLNARDARRGAILDGYPRTVRQNRDFQKMMQSRQVSMTYIELTVDDLTVVGRLTRRAALENRQDDTPAKIKTRLADYRRLTLPLLDKSEWPVYRIDGTGTPDATFNATVSAVSDCVMGDWLGANAAVQTDQEHN